MRKKKRGIFKKMMLGLLGVFVGVVLYVVMGILWTGSVEAWAGEQLQGIANHYLLPRLHLGKISYRGNRTIDIESLWLDAEDPDTPGKKVRIVEVASARMELAETPRWGKPLKISGLYLLHPVVRFVKGKKGGALAGFGNFVKGQAKAEPAAPPAASAPAEPGTLRSVANQVTGQTRPSDVFQIHFLEIDDGQVEYDSRAQGVEPEKLDGINAQMHISREGESGWYGVDIEAGRKPVVELSAKGRINVDTLEVGVRELLLAMELSAETKHYLPQNVQKLVEEYDMAGKLRLSARGQMPLAKPGEGDLTIGLKLSEGNFSCRGYAIPVESMEGEMGIRKNRAEVRSMSARAMGGRLDFSGACALDGKTPLRVKVHGEEIHLARTLKTFSKNGGTPAMAGLVSGDVWFESPVGRWDRESRGEGTLSLRHGHLPEMPVLGAIEEQIFQLGKNLLPVKMTHTDEADARFVFDGAVVRVRALSARSTTLGFRGSGDVDFGGAINMQLNAGPLEMVEKRLGLLGDIVGGVTDQVGRYRVGGTLSQPQVSVEVGPRHNAGRW